MVRCGSNSWWACSVHAIPWGFSAGCRNIAAEGPAAVSQCRSAAVLGHRIAEKLVVCARAFDGPLPTHSGHLIPPGVVVENQEKVASGEPGSGRWSRDLPRIVSRTDKS